MDEKQISELLECSVCLEPFDQNCKVLPCQHTFCRRCLDEISLTKQELRCPECRALVTQRVADLPTNILAVRILEGLKTQGYKASMGRDGGKFPLGHLGKVGSSPTRQQGLSPHKTRSDARGLQSGHYYRQGQSFAKALYDYESNEKEDLNFKKGDIIQLRRQIDENWYHGELSGKAGCFPANFVKIIIPLPQVPQSRALYDFDLKDENEKDCLTFQKDEILTVIRRVDDNWLEGRKGDKIGIFPLTFVELNDAARVLISTKANIMMPSIPATPVPVPANCPTVTTTASEESTLSVSPPVTSTSLISLSGPPLFTEPQQDTTTCETTTVITQSKLSSPLSSQSNSTTNTSTLSTETVMPSMSSNLFEELIVDTPQTKRHSYTSSPSRFSPVLSNTASQQRHSMEVPLNVESSQSFLNAPSSNGASVDITTGNTISSSVVSSSSEKNTGLALPPQLSPSPANIIEEPEDLASTSQGNQSENIQPLLPSTPLYVAIYNYLPQKDDELELQKGDQYIVVEKCQDGWFKGTCIKTGESGVFPGNYVNIIRHHSSVKPVNPNVLNIRAKVPISTMASSLHSNPLTSHTTQQQMNVGSNTILSSSQNQGAPPLLPRVPKTNSAGHKSRQFTAPPMRSLSSPVTTSGPYVPKHGISELSSSSRSSLGSSFSFHAVTTSPVHRSWASSFHHTPGSQTTTSSSTSVGMATSLDSHSFFGGSKEKDKKKKKEKEKRSLLKLLKDKKSKSPSTETETSQSAQAVPNDSVAHNRCGPFSSDVSSNPISGVESNSVTPHRKSLSLDSTPPPPIPIKPRPRPLPRERYCCIVPYPPQTDYELSLELGDIIHVHRKREDGWYKGTQERTGKTGMFPASFVEKCT